MESVVLSLRVDDFRSVLDLYDSIQVWRSATKAGTYAEITAPEPVAAQLVGSVASPWNLNGQSLVLTLDGAASVTVTFAGTNPLSMQQVLAQINAVLPGRASQSIDPDDRLILTSTIFGTQSSIQVSGAAATTLGLSTSQVVGAAGRIALTFPTRFYRFHDYSGVSTDFYETRYSNSVTGRVSAFSTPRQGDPTAVLGNQSTAIGTVDLCDGSGQPIVHRRVILVPQVQFAVPDTSFSVIPSTDKLIVHTDYAGHAEVTLVIGATYRLMVEGLQFERTFVCPDTDVFDLMAVATDQPDPFDVVQVPPRPIRVS